MSPSIHAILRGVPERALALRGEARVRDLSQRARRAACESARVSSLRQPEFVRDALERPIESDGVYWGVSHVSTMVAGVAARLPVAIDVERVRFRSLDAIRAALDEDEHEKLGGELLDAYFRAWTAKEAVLKLRGVGLAQLSETRIAGAPSPSRTAVSWRNEVFEVEHTWPSGHVAAAVSALPAIKIVWHTHTGPELGES